MAQKRVVEVTMGIHEPRHEDLLTEVYYFAGMSATNFIERADGNDALVFHDDTAVVDDGRNNGENVAGAEDGRHA